MRPQIARPQRRSLQPSGGDRASTPTLPVSNPPLSAPSASTDGSNGVVSLKLRICVYAIDCSSGPNEYVIHVIRRQPLSTAHTELVCGLISAHLPPSPGCMSVRSAATISFVGPTLVERRLTGAIAILASDSIEFMPCHHCNPACLSDHESKRRSLTKLPSFCHCIVYPSVHLAHSSLRILPAAG